MKNRLLVIGVAVAMLTVAVPASMASHFAVGTTEQVGPGPVESPVHQGNGPSVRGTVENTTDTPYGVATRPSEYCYSADGNVTKNRNASRGLSNEPVEAHTQDGLCNLLIYNENNGLERTSPVDQDYQDTNFVDTFDVQRTHFVGGGAGLFGFGVSCQPFCEDSQAQDALWNVTHDTGSDLGLTENSDDADRHNEGDRDRATFTRLDYAYPLIFVQQNTEAWEANGFTAPTALASFIGFLEGDDGPISQVELRNHVKANADGTTLPADANKKICGYVPQVNFGSTGAQTECDTPMYYVGQNESAQNHGDAPFGSYNDACQSPGYTCSPTGDYYAANSIGLLGSYVDRNMDDHRIWHWIVAPTAPDCGAVLPGFIFEEHTDAKWPYIAHDMDIYTPPQKFNESEIPHLSLDGHHAYRNALSSRVTSLQLPDLPGVIGDIQENASQAVTDTTRPHIKDDLTEPNNADTKGESFDDDARQVISVERGTLTDCQQLTDSETDQTRDPWVNIIDNGVTTNRDAVFQSWLLGSVNGPTVGTYGDNATAQDDENDPTTDTYSTKGFAGMFADMDDDGEYEQQLGNDDSADGFGEPIYKSSDIQATGAYPMLWDMHLNITEDGSPEVDEHAGCGIDPEVSISKSMFDAGYGPNTSLVQAIYLSEETVFTNADAEDPRVADYDGGNNIYVLLNQAGRVAWDNQTHDGADTLSLSEEIDGFLEDFVSYLENKQSVTFPTDANGDYLTDEFIEEPGDRLNVKSDFSEQCGESTGGYDSVLTFTHSCESGCAGDTIATFYTYEVRDGAPGVDDEGNPTFKGDTIPGLQVGDNLAPFSDAHSTIDKTHWVDIDPFDGDETRNEELKDRPPTGE